MITLKDFCEAVLKVIENGDPDKIISWQSSIDNKTHNCGLCSALHAWYDLNDHVSTDDYIRLYADMKASFKAKGLDECYPFNGGVGKEYHYERERGETYSNPARLAWVKEHAA